MAKYSFQKADIIFFTIFTIVSSAGLYFHKTISILRRSSLLKYTDSPEEFVFMSFIWFGFAVSALIYMFLQANKLKSKESFKVLTIITTIFIILTVILIIPYFQK